MLTVYFDFLCPYAWRGVELLHALELNFEPVHYSLVQGNHSDNKGLPRAEPVWKLSEQPLEAGSAHQRESLNAFIASHAAAQQGSALHHAFILELFRLRHRDSDGLDHAATLKAATLAQLDLERFTADQRDESARRVDLSRDLERAGQLGVFGTPTIQQHDGKAAYFRFATLSSGEAAQRAAWELFLNALNSDAGIETIKRAKPGSNA
jgi:predicted DsbA family dithiol-disulfide isomerase